MKIERKNTNRVSCNKLTRQQHTFYNYYLLHKLTYSHMYVIKTEEKFDYSSFKGLLKKNDYHEKILEQKFEVTPKYTTKCYNFL